MATLLSKGYNNSVYALRSGEFGSPVNGEWVAKAFKGNNYPQWEMEALTQMGSINSLMVKVWGIIPHAAKQWELLIMERLIPVQPRALDKEIRMEYLKKFLDELRELHSGGWAHGDLQRPLHVCRGDGDQWDNIIPTLEGIRLIDAGISVNEHDPLFDQVVSKDLQDFCGFAKWFMQDVIAPKEMIPILRGWLNI